MVEEKAEAEAWAKAEVWVEVEAEVLEVWAEAEASHRQNRIRLTPVQPCLRWLRRCKIFAPRRHNGTRDSQWADAESQRLVL